MLTYYYKLSDQAQAVTTSMSSLSAVSSLLIISIILRSPSKLSSVYHKIMFSLSCWDTLSSIAMALTTLPMSKDVLGLYMFEQDDEEEQTYDPHATTTGVGLPTNHTTSTTSNLKAYNFNGVVLGNAGTCAAQGFAITTGQAFAIFSNVTLSLYYVCTIRYKMTDETVRKKLIPIMVAICCLGGMPIFVSLLILGMFNPQPSETYCSLGSYPYLCNKKEILNLGPDYPECIRGDAAPNIAAFYTVVLTILLGLCFIVMMVSLVLVVRSVFQTEMSERRRAARVKTGEHDEYDDEHDDHHTRNNASTNTNGTEPNVSPEQQDQTIGGDIIDTSSTCIDTCNTHRRDIDDFQETRCILRVALMYIGAFFLTWIWTFMSTMLNNNLEELNIVRGIPSSVSTRTIMIHHIGHTIFLPSQGFFNALIFIYNKVCFARQAKPELTFTQALIMVICAPSNVSEALVSSLDMVENDIMNQREEEEEHCGENQNECDDSDGDDYYDDDDNENNLEEALQMYNRYMNRQ